MPYYRGDNYGRGDYYRGDPGILGSIAKGITKAASFIPGPIGTVAGIANTILGGNRPPGTAVQVRTPAAVLTGLAGAAAGAAGGAIAQRLFSGASEPAPPPVLMASGGPGGQGLVVGGTSMGSGKCGIQGYHLNKSGYYRRTPGGQLIYVEKNSACVKNRTMNPANGKALRRALRRATSFKKLAMKSIRLIDAGKKPKKFGGFKTKAKGR
jgi:hypothetical protein